MTEPTLDSFFGGGGKSFSWKEKPIGTTVTGTIKVVHPPQQATDPVDGSLVFNKKSGKPKMQVRIEMDTQLREDEEDDGVRNLYVGGWMQGAIGDAIRKAGNTQPLPGGQLTVTLTERQPNDNPALQAINKFSASYVAPSAAATNQFFQQNQAAAAPPAAAPAAPAAPPPPPAAPVGPARPPSIPEAAWANMDAATRQAVANTMGGNQSDSPPF